MVTGSSGVNEKSMSCGEAKTSYNRNADAFADECPAIFQEGQP